MKKAIGPKPLFIKSYTDIFPNALTNNDNSKIWLTNTKYLLDDGFTVSYYDTSKSILFPLNVTTSHENMAIHLQNYSMAGQSLN